MNSRKAQPVVSETTGGKTGNGLARQTHLTTAQPNRQAPNELLARAVGYALAGWRVLPLVPGGKNPVIPAAHGKDDPLRKTCKGECGREGHGVHDASLDPETIGAWWRQWPNANIGLALGDDLVCFDVDPRNGGTVDALLKLGLDPTATATQRTAGGGWHVIYQKPRNLAFVAHVPGVPGLDVLTGDRYIVAAPSIVDGRRYQWERDPLDVDPARIPLDLAERLTKRSPAAPQPAQDGPRAAQPAPRGNVPPFHVLEHALAHLDPWAGDYSWWLSCLMALHSAYPGADGLALGEAWGAGTPGEVAGKWATFDAGGGVTVATLLHHAKQAGWEPPAAADEADIPAAWRITADDWRTCPTCAALHVAPMTDGTVMAFHRWCRRPTCPVYRKVKARQALRVIFSWPGVQTVTVPAADWRKWRKLANLLHGDNWRAVPLAGGARLALYSVDSGGVPVDDVLHLAVGAILESEQARRAHRGKVAEAKAFLDALPLDEQLDAETWQKMQDALDVVASGRPGGNVSRPRRKRSEPALEAQPPTPRPKPLDTILVCSLRQRRAIFDVLNRLGIPWERRSYGGWRTEPLTPGQLAQLKTALVFGVPGARVSSRALGAGSYAELSTPPTDPPTGKVYLTAPQALVDAHKHGRKVPRLERVALE